MKKLATVAAALLLAVAALVGVRLLRLDAQRLAEAVALEAGAAFGGTLAFDRASLTAWPWPALRLHGVSARRGPALLRADEAWLGLSLPGLAAGEVVLRSLHVSRPDLRLPTGGELALPAPEPPARAPAASGLRYAITRVAIEDGRAAAGPWRLVDLRARGGLGLDLALGLEVEASAPGVGELREGRLELSGFLGGGETTWSAAASLEQVDLGALAERLGLALAVRGRGRLDLRAEGAGERLRDGELALRLPDVGLHGEGFALLGAIALDARHGEPWRLDLSEAELRVDELIAKPAGETLLLSATPDDALPPRVLRDVWLETAPLVVRARVELDGGPRLGLLEADADLEALRPWWLTPRHPVAGRIRIEEGRWDPAEGGPRIRAALHGVALPLDALAPPPEGAEPPAARGTLRIDGPLRLDAARLESSGLTLAVAGQALRVDGHLDLVSRSFEAGLESDGLGVGPVLAAFAGHAPLEGTFRARARIRGDGSLASLRGGGSFELVDGRVPEAAFPWPEEVLDPRLVSGEEGREFDRLSGRFELFGERLRVDRLAFWHPFVDAHLRGDVTLPGGQLDLAGEIEIREELDVALGGAGQRRTLTVHRVHGTLADPRFDVDQDAMRATFGRYAENLRAGRPR